VLAHQLVEIAREFHAFSDSRLSDAPGADAGSADVTSAVPPEVQYMRQTITSIIPVVSHGIRTVLNPSVRRLLCNWRCRTDPMQGDSSIKSLGACTVDNPVVAPSSDLPAAERRAGGAGQGGDPPHAPQPDLGLRRRPLRPVAASRLRQPGA
jgi:hypothetical protein